MLCAFTWQDDFLKVAQLAEKWFVCLIKIRPANHNGLSDIQNPFSSFLLLFLSGHQQCNHHRLYTAQ
jgi:hypothetical protein